MNGKSVKLLSLRRTLSNERGDALVLAMIMLAVSVISSLVMMQLTNDVEANSMRPRMKSMMAATEAKVREALLAPSTYMGCNATGRTSCDWIPSRITSLSRKVVGAACPTAVPCGIKVTAVSFEKSVVVAGETVSRANVLIEYEGTQWSLKPITIAMAIPTDVLQNSGIFQCPTIGAPKFNGFNPDGTMRCESLPAGAGVGQYVTQVNMVDLSTNVANLPPLIDCPGGIIGHVDWGQGGGMFNFSCAPKQEPFAAFGFMPGATAGDPTYVNNTD